MHQNKALKAQNTALLQDLVFSLLSKNERAIIYALGKVAHPLSLPELDERVSVSYRTLKRLVSKLEKKKLVFTFRDVIKVITLNPILLKGAE